MTGRLDEIAARADAASPGPWPRGGSLWVGRACDAEFVTHAREDIPWLLSQLRDARAEIERLDGLERDRTADWKRALGERDNLRAEVERLKDQNAELGETIEDTRADLADTRAEVERLHAVDFVHQGCAELRRKDNEYLIGKRDSLRAELADARAENERLNEHMERQRKHYVLVEAELAAERAKVAAGIETEKSSNATARKIIADLRAKLAAVEQAKEVSDDFIS